MITPGHVILGVGIMLLVIGIVSFIRERRRLVNALLVILGLGCSLLGVVIVTDDGTGAKLWVVLVMAVLIFAPIIGYPLLAFFLLINGVMMVKREQRTLGNLLSLITGIGFVLLPIAVIVVLNLPNNQHVWTTIGVGIVLFASGVALYLAFFFLVFLVAALAYGKIPANAAAEYVIVLGSGLIGRRVPPLLASRLDKGIEVAAAQKPPAVIIPSGGKGPDEEISEADGMAAYLRDHGVDSSRILEEDQARNTRQNLEFSQKLLPDPHTHVFVVTNNYHVFRAAMLTKQLGIDATVVGAKTAGYYVPSAFLREFAAVLKENLVLNASVVGVWAVLSLALTAISFMSF